MGGVDRTEIFNYKGKVYILINGISISGSADVAALVHYHKKATFIGEESGGAYYGNNSGDFLNLTLPNTGIKIRIPIRSCILSVSDYPYVDRGVIPDFEVKPRIEDISRGVDTELDFTIGLIKQGIGKN